MSGGVPPAGPSDPAGLSPQEKDALIRELRRQVAAGRSEVRLLRRRLGFAEQAADRSAGELLDRLREADPRPTAAPPATLAVRLGRGLGLWQSPVVLGTAAAVLMAFAVDGAIGIWQERSLAAQREARLLMEHEALTSMFVELKRIVPEPDGRSFLMTLFMQNVDPAVPLYVMLNAVGVYVQVGMGWQQVPSTPLGAGGTGVVKLVDSHTYEVRFTPDVTGWAELIPGYMHVRLQADMLVSRKAEPGTAIAERRTPYYVYLKPHGADDAEIKRRSKMSGTPPVFIPMPPH
ncbi:hypothetical protein [Reyranella sp.]|uniref:hypothetical protein n=1 Tax=Reyranella sp. TaxID=1929291 RepID=UPI003BAC8CA0